MSELEKIGTGGGEEKLIKSDKKRKTGAKKIIPGFIWIQRNNTPGWKIKINETEYQQSLRDGNFTKILNGVGKCKLKLFNRAERYSDTFSYGDTIKLFLDFEDMSTLVWQGEIESIKIDTQQTAVIIDGIFVTRKFLDVTVTESYENKDPSNILKDLIDGSPLGQANRGDGYAPEFSYNNVQLTDERVDIKWSNKPLFDCIKDLANLVDYNFYISVSTTNSQHKDIHFFPSGDEVNQNEAGVSFDNLKRIDGLGDYTGDIKNKITVHGETPGGLPIIATANDNNSQSEYGVREKVIKNQDISTYNQAKQKAKAELALNKSKAQKGKITTYFLPTLNPGQMLWVSDPPRGIHDKYQVNKVIHNISRRRTITEISEVKGIPELFQESREKEMHLEKITNPHRLENSFNITIEDASSFYVFNKTEVSGGELRITSGNSDGSAVSNTRSSDDTITKAQIYVEGNNLGDAIFYLTANGSDYEQVTLEELHEFTDTGTTLKLRVVLNDASTIIDEITVLYE